VAVVVALLTAFLGSLDASLSARDWQPTAMLRGAAAGGGVGVILALGLTIWVAGFERSGTLIMREGVDVWEVGLLRTTNILILVLGGTGVCLGGLSANLIGAHRAFMSIGRDVVISLPIWVGTATLEQWLLMRPLYVYPQDLLTQFLVHEIAPGPVLSARLAFAACEGIVLSAAFLTLWYALRRSHPPDVNQPQHVHKESLRLDVALVSTLLCAALLALHLQSRLSHIDVAGIKSDLPAAVAIPDPGACVRFSLVESTLLTAVARSKEPVVQMRWDLSKVGVPRITVGDSRTPRFIEFEHSGEPSIFDSDRGQWLACTEKWKARDTSVDQTHGRCALALSDPPPGDTPEDP